MEEIYFFCFRLHSVDLIGGVIWSRAFLATGVIRRGYDTRRICEAIKI